MATTTPLKRCSPNGVGLILHDPEPSVVGGSNKGPSWVLPPVLRPFQRPYHACCEGQSRNRCVHLSCVVSRGGLPRPCGIRGRPVVVSCMRKCERHVDPIALHPALSLYWSHRGSPAAMLRRGAPRDGQRLARLSWTAARAVMARGLARYLRRDGPPADGGRPAHGDLSAGGRGIGRDAGW